MKASRYDAVVVGSGVGGCVTAALLAHAGARVLVLEKNPVPGGILASICRDGFKMDFGSHLISRGVKGPLGHVLRMLGLSQPGGNTQGVVQAASLGVRRKCRSGGWPGGQRSCFPFH